jgi:pimeloyl-ACP methyl ester carboxylesterase
MATATAKDGVKLYYEATGEGPTVIFVHEFAGDMRAWEPQMRHLGRRYHCVAYNARGYPPSDVPEAGMYSQNIARDDILAVMDAVGAKQAHIVGLSMGGFAALHFAMEYPERTSSAVVAGCGYGAEPDKQDQFRRETAATARLIERQGAAEFALAYSLGPTRVQFQNKNPRGFQEFQDQLAEHSTDGAARTMLGVQRERPSLFQLKDRMAKITAPTLVLTGDEDWPCLLPGILMKECIPTAALVVMPNCGHTINIEDPQAFNAAVDRFLSEVESGTWPTRDPRAMSGAILGLKDGE